MFIVSDVKPEVEDHSAPRMKNSSKKPFNCADCSKGFKRLAKLMRHVEKHHSAKTKTSIELNPDADATDIQDLLAQSAKCVTGRWPCSVRTKKL